MIDCWAYERKRIDIPQVNTEGIIDNY